jgi:hypothetical protein
VSDADFDKWVKSLEFGGESIEITATAARITTGYIPRR